MAKKIDRRQFLKTGLGAAASLPVLGWAFPETASAAGFPGAILIQVELLGGCDNANFSAFRNGLLYDAFKGKRTTAASNTPAEVVPIDAAGIDPVGLHPELGGPLRSAGHLSNVRLLLNQTNDPLYNDGSHEVMQKLMAMGSVGTASGSTGTFARLYDVGIPLFGFDGRGENYTCVTCNTPPLRMDSLESFNLSGYSLYPEMGGVANTDHAVNTLTNLVNLTPNRTVGAVEKKYKDGMGAMFGAFNEVKNILQTPSPLYSSYTISDIPLFYPGDTYKGDDLWWYNYWAVKFRNIAEIINYRKANTQPLLFNIGLGSFDVHTDWTPFNASMMYRLGRILSTFFSDLKAMGVWNRTILYTTTEFGRRIYWNGSGTDHGGGFTSLIAGGRIKRGVFGDPMTVSQINSLDNWPMQYDFRAVICQLVQNHLGKDPRIAYPGTTYDLIQNKTTNFDLFVA